MRLVPLEHSYAWLIYTCVTEGTQGGLKQTKNMLLWSMELPLIPFREGAVVSSAGRLFLEANCPRSDQFRFAVHYSFSRSKWNSWRIILIHVCTVCLTICFQYFAFFLSLTSVDDLLLLKVMSRTSVVSGNVAEASKITVFQRFNKYGYISMFSRNTLMVSCWLHWTV